MKVVELKLFLDNIFLFLKKINFIIEAHSFLNIANVLSLMLGISSYIYAIHKLEPDNKTSALCFLILPLMVYFISFLSFKLFEMSKILSRFISCIVNTFLIFMQILILLLFMLYISIIESNAQCYDVNYYPEKLKHMNQQYVLHFPKEIPKEATDIAYRSTHSLEMYLKFDIDEKYIDNELKKHTYVIISPKEKLSIHDYPFFLERCDLKDLTFYVIGDFKHATQLEKQNHKPFHYGIAVNKEKSKIVYYYAEFF